jgi:hypothetical protein
MPMLGKADSLNAAVATAVMAYEVINQWRIFADTVRVTVDGRSLQGCGGAILPPATLQDTSWEIVTIDGGRVPGGEQYRIGFSADGISGRAGCNSFSGNYRVGRDGFQAGPLAMTRMACPGQRHAARASGQPHPIKPRAALLSRRPDAGDARC